ncbi:MAG: hypothetical protein HUK28_06090 [Methanobrevibacter sp.]|nr:hypothetical protein [Methanobrevibacter sp.]
MFSLIFGLFAADFYKAALRTYREFSKKSSEGIFSPSVQDKMVPTLQNIINSFLYSSIALFISIILGIVGIYLIYNRDNRSFIPFLIGGILNIITSLYLFFYSEQFMCMYMKLLDKNYHYGSSDFTTLAMFSIVLGILFVVTSIIYYRKTKN